MKQLLMLFTVITVTNLRAENLDSANASPKNVITFDVSGFARQFFTDNSSNYYYNAPYLIGYRRVYESVSFRIGLGGDISNTESVRRDSILDKREMQAFNIRVGLEKYLFVYNRWSSYFGADMFYQYDHMFTRTEWGSVDHRALSSRTWNLGVSPLFGVIFKINRHIALSTELGLDLAYSESRIGEYWYDAQYGSKNSMGSAAGLNADFIGPMSFTLRVGF